MNGLGQLIHLHLAIRILIGTGLVFQRGDAVFLVTIQPGADGAPGEPVRVT